MPAIVGSCWTTHGAQLVGTVIRTKPFWALAVMSWPDFPGTGHFVAVGSHRGLVENQATGFSCCWTCEVLGLMDPELMIARSFKPVV